MKIAICDDIIEYRISVKAYINEYFKIHYLENTIYEFGNGETLLNSNESYDIIFLDIELGDSNGIDVAKEIQKRNKNTIILIITYYRQYLDAAMDLNVTRYIDKPITQERIYSALDKAMSQINESIITLHSKDKRLIRLNMNEIIYAEAKLKKVIVFTDNDAFVVKETMKDLRNILTASCFAVPHNSYIVNLNYVKDFKREEIGLIKPYEKSKISIATRKQPDFKRKFLDFIGEDCNND